MKHQICEICGASLDFGERCDCENIHNALPAATSDKSNAPLDTPKEVSGNVEIDLPAVDLSNPSAEIAAPMPRYIKDMINRYRLERR